jgi:hypothetical protein
LIVKGGSRSSAAYWSKHLLRTDHNERVEILEMPSGYPPGAESLAIVLRQFQNMVKVTDSGKKGLYCGHIDPDGQYAMSAEDWQKSIGILERHLGFEGQPRVAVKHIKDGREHVHVIWQRSRLNHATGRVTLLSDSWNYKHHEIAARRMEKTLGHEHIKGVFTGRARDEKGRCMDERPVAEINHAEWQQGVRTGKNPKEVKAEIEALWGKHRDGSAFKTALEQSGYALAQGDKKPVYMIVDRAGEAHELRRCIKGVKKPELETRLESFPAKSLPTVAAIRENLRGKEQQQQQGQQRPPVRLQGPFRAANDNRVLHEQQDAPEREIIMPRQQRQAAQAMVAAVATAENAWHARQAAQVEALRGHQEVKIRLARQAWREIAEPMQRREALTAGLSQAGRLERVDRTERAASDEAERERYEAHLRAEKRNERLVDKQAELYEIRNTMTLRHLDENRDMDVRHRRQRENKASELEPIYANTMKRLEKTIAAAQGRLSEGGVLYGLLRAGRDRRTVATRTAELEHAKWREDEAWQPLRSQQREERGHLEKTQADDTRRMDEWIQGSLRDFEQSLDRAATHEQGQDHSQQRSHGGEGGTGRGRSLGVQASPLKSRRRGPVRVTGRDRRKGEWKYRPKRDNVMPERGQRYTIPGRTKPRKGAANYPWMANAYDMVHQQGVTPHYAPLFGRHAGRQPRGPEPGS